MDMKDLIPTIKAYKGKVIPDGLFDAIIALLEKVDDARKATRIYEQLRQSIVTEMSYSSLSYNSYSNTLTFSILATANNSDLCHLLTKLPQSYK